MATSALRGQHVTVCVDRLHGVLAGQAREGEQYVAAGEGDVEVNVDWPASG